MPCKQDKTDREQAASFIDTIDKGTVLASKGDLDDSTSGNEAIWVCIAEGKKKTNDVPFLAAGGTGASGLRTINANWRYVDVRWLVKVKTDSVGDVHYEEWKHPSGDRTVLTMPKILTVQIRFEREYEVRNGPKRWVMSAATYQHLVDAVKDKDLEL